MMQTLLDADQLAGALFIAAFFILAGFILTWLVRRGVNELLRHASSAHLDRITLSFLSRFSILAIWLLLATFYSHLIPALHRLGTALLTGVSLVSIIMGFAAQTTLGNLVSGISLILYKPFQRGDKLRLQTPDGPAIAEVEDISLGYTMLRIDDGRQLIIANSTMAQTVMIKLSGDEPSQKLP